MKYLGYGVHAHSRTGRRIGPGTLNVLTNGVLNARVWLASTLDKLTFARGHLDPQTVINDPYGATRVIEVRQAAMLTLNVPDQTTTIRQALGRVATALGLLQAGFDVGFDIVDIDSLTRLENAIFPGCTGGYVNRELIGDGRGRIHLNFKWLRRIQRVDPGVGARLAAWVIVHEGTHKWALSKDHAYCDRPAYHQLTWQQSTRNADSLAAFVYLVANPDKLDAANWPVAPYLW